jgi:2'-5' RNA ligase
MRLFIALEMPEEVKQAAHAMIRELMSCGAEVKWVRPELMHLTSEIPGRNPKGQGA